MHPYLYRLICKHSPKVDLIVMKVNKFKGIYNFECKVIRIASTILNFVSVFQELEEKTQTILVDADLGEGGHEYHEKAHGILFLLLCFASITNIIKIFKFNFFH